MQVQDSIFPLFQFPYLDTHHTPSKAENVWIITKHSSWLPEGKIYLGSLTYDRTTICPSAVHLPQEKPYSWLRNATILYLAAIVKQ